MWVLAGAEAQLLLPARKSSKSQRCHCALMHLLLLRKDAMMRECFVMGVLVHPIALLWHLLPSILLAVAEQRLLLLHLPPACCC
jgi:hypothetical protein